MTLSAPRREYSQPRGEIWPIEMIPYQPLPEMIYRVGRRGRTWNLADWKYAPFTGRWDDPRGEYRVRYVALDPVGALVEKLQAMRPDLSVVAGESEIEGGGNPVLPVLPPSWFKENELGIAQLVLEEVELADLATGEGLAAAAAGLAAAQRASGICFERYDFTTIMTIDRTFTQALGRWIYDNYDFAGIVYRSRFAPEQLCIALFETRHNLSVSTARIIRPSELAVKAASRVHKLFLSAECDRFEGTVDPTSLRPKLRRKKN